MAEGVGPGSSATEKLFTCRESLGSEINTTLIIPVPTTQLQRRAFFLSLFHGRTNASVINVRPRLLYVVNYQKWPCWAF